MPDSTLTNAPSSDSSGIATAPPAPVVSRLQVRRRAGDTRYTARTLVEGQDIKLATREVYGRPGDYVVQNAAGQIVDCLPPINFVKQYEEINEAALTILGPDRTILEQALGFGSTQSSSVLAQKVRALAALSIGPIAIDFTPAQWEELKTRASKRGIRVEDLLRQLLDKFTQDLWTAL